MKILFYCDTVFGYGGVERVLSVIAKAMTEHHDVTILSTDMRADTAMYGYDKSDVKFEYISYPHKNSIERLCCKAYSYLYKKMLPKCSVTSEGYSKSFFLPSYKKALTEKINSGGYDVVIGVHAFLSLHLASIRKHMKAKKVIGWMHNSYEALFVKDNPYLPGLRHFFTHEMKKLDNIVVLSKADVKRFQQELGLRSVCIYNPLTLEPHGRASFNNKRFIGVGRFAHKHKGFDILLKAFAEYCKRHDDGWTLELVGEGPELPMYEEIIKANNIGDRVTISPFTNDIQSHYAGASVYVLSSRWEGFGLVQIEAMSHGLPIIASDIPVAKELLEDSGTCLFFRNEDVDDLVKKMEQIVDESLWLKMSGKAIIHSKQYNIENIMQKWHDIILSQKAI